VFDCFRPMSTELKVNTYLISHRTLHVVHIYTHYWVFLYSPEIKEIRVRCRKYCNMAEMSSVSIQIIIRATKKVSDVVQNLRECTYQIYAIFRIKWICQTGALIFCTQSYIRIFFSVSLSLVWLLAPETCIIGQKTHFHLYFTAWRIFTT
jgi:hypothetical protein